MLRGKGLLTPIQRSFIAEFATLPDQAQFYLAGGTALAEFYLGHRLSFDHADAIRVRDPDLVRAVIRLIPRRWSRASARRTWPIAAACRSSSPDCTGVAAGCGLGACRATGESARI